MKLRRAGRRSWAQRPTSNIPFRTGRVRQTTDVQTGWLIRAEIKNASLNLFRWCHESKGHMRDPVTSVNAEELIMLKLYQCKFQPDLLWSLFIYHYLVVALVLVPDPSSVLTFVHSKMRKVNKRRTKWGVLGLNLSPADEWCLIKTKVWQHHTFFNYMTNFKLKTLKSFC